MNLKIQVISLLFSFLFGVFLGILFKFNERFIYSSKKYEKIISTFLFVIINVLLYFIILKHINYGILHIYEILAIIVGTIAEYFVEKKLINKFERLHKKWYNLK